MEAAFSSCSDVIKLADGHDMPVFGLGLFDPSYDKTACTKAAVFALQHGYKMLDTATMYKNEDATGMALRQAEMPREDIFVVTKLLWDDHGRDTARSAFLRSLQSLQLKYVDLYLIHSACGGKLLETYDSLLQLQKEGLIKSLGVSNFGIDHLEGLRKAGRPAPVVNQIELHPFHQQLELVKYCQDHDIALTAWSPMAQATKFENKTVKAIAKKYGKSPAQVLLRWAVEHRYIIIPKSFNQERIIANKEVYNWKMAPEDVAELNKLEEEEPFAVIPGTPPAQSWDELN